MVEEFESEWFDRVHTSKAFTIRIYETRTGVNFFFY